MERIFNSRRLRLTAGACALLGLHLQPALAQDGGAQVEQLRDFCADRPGKATPPCILDKGHVQLEVGLVDAAFQRDSGEHDDDYMIGQFELRYGFTRRTELEATWTPTSIERGDTHRTGVGDLQLGFRTALSDPDGDGPATAFQAFVSAPTGTADQGEGDWEGGVRLPFATDLARGFSLGVTPEVDLHRDGNGHGRHAALSNAVSLGHEVGPASLSVELWAERDLDPGAHASAASFDVSAAWQAMPNLQLDVGANAGLTHDTPDVEIYAGFARRF